MKCDYDIDGLVSGTYPFFFFFSLSFFFLKSFRDGLDWDANRVYKVGQVSEVVPGSLPSSSSSIPRTPRLLGS